MDGSKETAITDNAEQPKCKMCKGFGTMLVLQLSNLVIVPRNAIIEEKPIVRVDADSVGEFKQQRCPECGGTGLNKEKRNV